MLGKALGNVFIGLLYLVIGSVYYVFVGLYYPDSSYFNSSVLFFFHTLLLLQQWALVSAIFSDPGQVPQYWGFRMGDSEAKRRRYCLMCHTFKPDRCHHCSACARCVINMDHHCPWINNCIGFHNRKIFILLLCYSLLLTYFVLLFMFPATYAAMCDICRSFQDPMWQPKLYPGLMYVAFFVFLGLLSFAMTVFTKFHLHLVLINSTTIESLEKTSQFSKFSINLHDNWVQVFGNNPAMWVLPFYGKSGKPVGDGVTWQLNPKEVSADATNRDSVTERGAYPAAIPPPIRLACSGEAKEETTANQSGVMLNHSQVRSGMFSDPDSEASFIHNSRLRHDHTDQSFQEIEERSEDSHIVSPQTAIEVEASPRLPIVPRPNRSSTFDWS